MSSIRELFCGLLCFKWNCRRNRKKLENLMIDDLTKKTGMKMYGQKMFRFKSGSAKNFTSFFLFHFLHIISGKTRQKRDYSNIKCSKFQNSSFSLHCSYFMKLVTFSIFNICVTFIWKPLLNPPRGETEPFLQNEEVNCIHTCSLFL